MNRRRTAIGCFLLALTLALPALAQEEGGEGAKPDEGAAGGEQPPSDATPPPSDAAPPSDATPPPSDDALKTTPDAPPPPAATTSASASDAKESWKDIVVLPRKYFLKSHRVELMPYFGVTMNDNLIQHYSLGGEINYFLTDILSIGVSGRYYFKNVLDEEFWTRYHFGRVPSLNRYIYTATFNFSYVPFYGKFAVFNKSVMHWELYASAGVGISGSEIIPRDYQNEAFNNMTVISFRMPGLGARLFITKWLAAHILFEGIGMIDKYEPSPRALGTTGAEAKDQASSAFVYNMMFNVGVSFFLPPSFKYTTFR